MMASGLPPPRPSDHADADERSRYRRAIGEELEPQARQCAAITCKRLGVSTAAFVVFHLDLLDQLGADIAEAVYARTGREHPGKIAGIATAVLPRESALTVIRRFDDEEGTTENALEVPLIEPGAIYICVIASRGVAVGQLQPESSAGMGRVVAGGQA
jgi:hypothetical protein